MAFCIYNSLIGKLSIEEQNGKIVRVELLNDKSMIDEEDETPLLTQAKTQLDEYFNQTRKTFDLPLLLVGSEYMVNIWNQLLKIPYGKTYTYGQIAQMAGNKKAARSAGMACGKNKIMIIVPCHRVIGANGDLTGFNGGIDIKIQLLELEKTATN